jgi:hypothetical protein
MEEPSPTEWAHMMVNMIVGCDFRYSPHSNPLSIGEINRVLTLNKIGLQIPSTWTPQSFDA